MIEVALERVFHHLAGNDSANPVEGKQLFKARNP